MERDINTGIRQHGTIALRHRQPVNIHTHVIEELADFQPCSRLTDGHHLVESSLHFKPIAHIVRSEATRHVMLFKDQDIFNAPRLELQACRHACQCTAYNDHLIMVFIKAHVLYSFLNKFQGAVRKRSAQSLIKKTKSIRRISPRVHGNIPPSHPCHQRT